MKSLRSNIGYVLGFAALFVPVATFAHVKWFVDADEVVARNHGITPFYYLTSKEVIIWALIATLIVVLFSIFDRIIPEPKSLHDFGERHKKGITRAVEMLVGLLLISVTFLWNIILVPNFPIHSDFTIILGFAQLIAGIIMLFGFIPRITTSLVAIIYFVMGLMLGWVPFVENMILLVVLFYIFVRSSPSHSRFYWLNKYVVEIVRIGVAVSLITLAFTEKLMYPELGLSFLDEHQWNFMQLIGISWFDNRLFVLSAGFSELIFGIIFIFGYLTRINTLIMAGFFAMSVVTMFLQFHMWEMEDLVVYAAAIIFIFYGYGKTRFFHKMSDDSIWKRVHLGRLLKIK